MTANGPPEEVVAHQELHARSFWKGVLANFLVAFGVLALTVSWLVVVWGIARNTQRSGAAERAAIAVPAIVQKQMQELVEKSRAERSKEHRDLKQRLERIERAVTRGSGKG